MPPSEPSRVFLSYARKDGAALAQRLQKDLKEQGFDAWLDTQRIAGGRTWSTQIEREIDTREITVAVLTDGSYKSGMCRGEQIRAMRKGKRLIPVLGTKGVDIPVYIEALHYRDFTNTDDANYAARFAELLADIRGDAAAILPDTFRVTSYVTVPPLPVNFVERPEALAALRDALITDDGGRHIALTALQGMGGIGKTVLAQALCHDEVVQQAFPDGVVWITIGKESAFDALTRMREVGKALGDDLSRYENELAAKNQYRSTIRKKAALIVVDDVWRSSDLEPLRAEDSPRSRLLFTTRDATIAAAMGAREHVADLLTGEQSREVLARWSRTKITNLPPIAAQLIHECGRLPLALSMVGAMLRGKPAAYWKAVLEHLRNADLDKIKAQFPDYPYTDVLRAIQVSVDSLDETSRARYLALAVLLEEMAAAPSVQQCLWGVDEKQATETAEQFVSLSLAQRDQPEGSIRLHDLQLDYVRAQYPKEDNEALELIHGAIRLSAHVIEKDQAQFASQMVGRLLTYQDMPAIADFTKRIAEWARKPWLRPLRPTLIPPGGALTRTLGWRINSVSSLAVSGDGRLVVSTSYDRMLKVWDVTSGRELRTLAGHTDQVWGAAVSADGKLAVSASWDKTLKVWDVESGRELRTLAGHTGGVRGAAICGDGRLVVSASDDCTLKVWDVDSGRELRTLSGHTGTVWSVAVSADGKLAVSASNDCTLKVWDVDSGRELRTLSGHSTAVDGVAVSADGKLAVSASSYGSTLKVWDMASGHELRTLSGNTVSLSADGKLAVSASPGKTLKVWDVGSGCELLTLRGHTDRVNHVVVSADGQLAVSSSDDRTLKVWELAHRREHSLLADHTDWVRGVAVSADGKLAVSASNDPTLKVWDIANGRELPALAGHTVGAADVALSADGKLAVSVSASPPEALKIWDVPSGHELHTLTGHTRVAITADAKVVVSPSGDQALKVWDVASGHELRTLSGHTGSVTGVAVSADGKLVVSASFHDQTLKVWDVVSGSEFRTLSRHADGVSTVAVSPDGRLAVSASWASTCKVWDVASGHELRTLSGHTGSVTGVAVSADGKLVVSASQDNTLKVWEIANGSCLATFSCDAPVTCCAIAKRVVLAGDGAGRVHMLTLDR